MRTTFDPKLGDRVARKPGATGGMPKDAARNWSEAIEYATNRARETGQRQLLRQCGRHGWWLVIMQDEAVEV